MKRGIVSVLAATLLVVAATGAHAARTGSNGKCWADPGTVEMGQSYVLRATGLPTDKALNVWISDANGTVGYPFGMSHDGTEAWDETASVYGSTTYTVSGAVRGNMKIYASCSMDVS